MEVVGRRLLPDVRARLAEALAEDLARADLVILSGGVSEGDFDCVPDAMRDVGLHIHFDRVAVKPGKPLTFATGDAAAAFGLPGNPVSVFVGFHLFVLRAARLLGGTPASARSFRVPLARAFSRRGADRLAFLPCRLDSEGRAETIDYHGSAHLLALCEADGLLCVPAGQRALAAGDPVEFFPLRL
jgi:molybdopterin molybdotransferase